MSLDVSNVLTSFGTERSGTSKFESKKTTQRFGWIKLFYVLPCLYIYYIYTNYSAQFSIFGSQETDFTNQREVSSFNEVKTKRLFYQQNTVKEKTKPHIEQEGIRPMKMREMRLFWCKFLTSISRLYSMIHWFNIFVFTRSIW